MSDQLNEEASRDIPDGVKLEARQRCGFGCVICGLPLYQYDHLLGYAKVKRHRAEEITLLCHQHHGEKTGKLLPDSEVERANADPVNRRTGASAPYRLHYSGNVCRAAIGATRFRFEGTGDDAPSTAVALGVDDQVLVGFDLIDHHVLLTLNVFDEENRQVLKIERNELVYSTDPWDISFEGRRLKIRAASGKYLTEVLFDPPDQVSILRGHFLYNGVDVLVRPHVAIIVNNMSVIKDFGSDRFRSGIVIGGAARLPSALLLNGNPRYEMYSEADRKDARALARNLLS